MEKADKKSKKEVTKKTSSKTEKTTKPKEKKPKIEQAVPEEIVVQEEIASVPDDLGEEAFAAGKDADLAGKPERYWEAVGRRKTAIARVRLFTRGDKTILVNGKPYGEYFFSKNDQRIAEDSLQKMKSTSRFRVSVLVGGGGLKAQAEAIRHGLARALVEFNPDFRKRLRRAGYLTRDPRMKERKKFGLKSARRRPQWAKR